MTEPLLKVRDLALSFGGLRALQGVDLDVSVGSTAGLIGPNGAGKTTFFNAVTGFIRPAAGSVLFAGEELIGVQPYAIARRGLVRTFQRTRPLSELTVLENVMAGGFRNGYSGPLATMLGSRKARREEAAIRQRALALLERLGLRRVIEVFPSQLTAGQRRLLEIARALAAEPRMLLLDEPAAGLNREETFAVAKVIGSLPDAGITCLLVEHDVEMVFHVCDQVTVLNYGQVIARGSPAQVRCDPAVIESYLGRGKSVEAVERMGHA